MTHPRLMATTENRPKTGIVHLGLGAFFRAHGALYIADAMEKSGGDWGVIGVSLRSAGTRDKLAAQGHAYTAVEVQGDAKTPRVVEVLNDVLVAPENPDAVIDAMAHPDVKIVSLTITEKGYCAAAGGLNADHPEIVNDIANATPTSAPGYLVRALQKRMDAGLAPFTVMSMDNMPDNGTLTRAIVVGLADKIDPNLAEWITSNGAFPSTMVDRIVPAPSDADLAAVTELTGRDDHAALLHEPFRQWVIEDTFVNNARPDFGTVGAQLVDDVTVFEHMKLRMLNGSHSTLAYSGCVAGHATIPVAVADPVFHQFVSEMWVNEIIPSLTPPAGVDLVAYSKALMGRFENTAIQHKTAQIAMDGSQKLPQRILSTLTENEVAGRANDKLLFALATWIRYLSGPDDAGNAMEISDPLADDIASALAGAITPETRVQAVLSLNSVFDGHPIDTYAPRLTAHLTKIETLGQRDAMKGLLS